MGACGSSAVEVTPEAAAKDNEISKELRKEKKALSTEAKLILLGAGESGKSTILKQMKIIHLNGFTDKERAMYKDIIHSNCVMSMRSLILGAMRLDIKFDSKQNEKIAQNFLSESLLNNQVVNDEIAEQITTLWKDSGLQKAWKQNHKFQINDTANYFFDRLTDVCQDEYVPSDDDILHSRTRTTGVNEAMIPMGGNSIRMIDVGGQRNERRKWIHCFQDVTAVLFVVSLSEYDQTLFEDESVPRVREAMTLFEEICSCSWFIDCGIVLFLNKSDLFAEKLQRSPLNDWFPDYKGASEFKEAVHFFRAKFEAVNHTNKTIYCHVTCATDTQNIRFVFQAVRDTINQHSLSRSFKH